MPYILHSPSMGLVPTASRRPTSLRVPQYRLPRRAVPIAVSPHCPPGWAWDAVSHQCFRPPSLAGLGALGWSDMERWLVGGQTPCSEIRGGHKVCFVSDDPVEQACAREVRCLRLPESCETEPAGNPGGVWCCPSGAPSTEPGCGVAAAAGQVATVTATTTGGETTAVAGKQVVTGGGTVAPASAPVSSWLTPMNIAAVVAGVAALGGIAYLLLSSPPEPQPVRYTPSRAMVAAIPALPAYAGS